MVLWTTGQILPLQHTTSPKLEFNRFPSSFSLPTFLAETNDSQNIAENSKPENSKPFQPRIHPFNG